MSANITETKQCPYCAETIKTAAVMCRFCGAKLSEARHTNAEMLDNATAWYIEKGWQLDTGTSSSLHFRKPKKWSRTLVVGGVLSVAVGLCVWPLLAILGAAFLVLAVVDYLIKTDKKLNVTLLELESGAAPSGDDSTEQLIALLAAAAFALVIIVSR